MIIDIDVNMVYIARKLAKCTVDALEQRRGHNYTGLNAQDRWFNGYLGEQVFLKYLKTIGKNGVYSPIVDGYSDKFDFIVLEKISRKIIKIDVKTASKPWHYNLMLPEAQANHLKNNVIFVGVRLLSEKRAEVVGCCTVRSFEKKADGFDDQRVPTLFCHFSKLQPMENLTRQLEDGHPDEYYQPKIWENDYKTE